MVCSKSKSRSDLRQLIMSKLEKNGFQFERNQPQVSSGKLHTAIGLSHCTIDLRKPHHFENDGDRAVLFEDLVKSPSQEKAQKQTQTGLLVYSVSTSYELRIKHMVNPQQASSPLQHREPGAATQLPHLKNGEAKMRASMNPTRKSLSEAEKSEKAQQHRPDRRSQNWRTRRSTHLRNNLIPTKRSPTIRVSAGGGQDKR